MESGSSLWKSSRFEFNYRCVRATIAKGYDCTNVIIIFAFLFFSFSNILSIKSDIEMILKRSRKNFCI